MKNKKQGRETYFPPTSTVVPTAKTGMKDTNYIETSPLYQHLICCRITQPRLPKIQISILKYHLKSSHVLGMVRALTSVWVSENCTKVFSTTFPYMLLNALCWFFSPNTEAWHITSCLIFIGNHKKLFSITRENWLRSTDLNHPFNQRLPLQHSLYNILIFHIV